MTSPRDFAVTNPDRIPAASSSEPSPGDSIANSPLFKLPPELRNRIYGYVFGPSEVITPDVHCWSRASLARQWHIRDYDDDDEFPGGENKDGFVQTSILSVCKVVKAEAIEVLYDSKILRGWPIDLDVMLKSHDVFSRVRRIEITGLLELYNHHSPQGRSRHARHLRNLLERLQRLPRLISILILSDCLTSESHRLGDAWVPVMDFVQVAGLEPATCVDIGRFQLHGKFEDVQIVNCELVELWPAVRDTPEGYDGFEEAVALINRLESSIDVPNVSSWASHTSLRCWVDIQQQLPAMKASGEWDRLRAEASTGAFGRDNNYTDDEFKHDFFNHAAILAVSVGIDEFPLLRSGQHILKLLQPNANSDVLDEVSEFLAANIAFYNHRHEQPFVGSPWELRPIVWGAKGKGNGKTRLEYMAEQQSITLSGGASKEFVLDPSADNNVPARNLIGKQVFMDWIRDFDRKDWMHGVSYHDATPAQIKQLTHLHLAVLEPFALDSDDQHRRDDWAKGLMVRYMMAAGILRQDEVERTSLADLRTIMSIVLDVFEFDRYGDGHDWVKSCSCDAALPPNFDDDVYPGLGWRYGELLAQAFQRYNSQSRVSKTLARQWVKEGTMWR